MCIGDLAAARRMVLRADQLETIGFAQWLHMLDKQVAECERLAAHFGHVGFEHQVDADFERGEAEHRRGSALEAFDPGGGVIILLESEGPRVAEPAREHRGGGMMTRRSEEQTSELQSLMRISYAGFLLEKQTHIL